MLYHVPSGSKSSGSGFFTGLSRNISGNAQPAAAQEGQKAHVMIPAKGSKPDVTVNLVKEGGDWKIDIPDTIDGKQLAQNLQTQLSRCQAKQAQWPSDQTQTQAGITHAVVL